MMLNKLHGSSANAAKYLSGKAAYTACERAILTHGGMGYAKETHVSASCSFQGAWLTSNPSTLKVERYFREVMITRIAPVSEQMIMKFVRSSS